VRHVEDGEEALAYVRNEGKYAAAERPSLILLDLNLPKIDGRSVLQQLKSDRRLRSIPIIVLTTSNDPEDVNRCYELQANGYVVKPFNYLEFTDQIKRLSDFWLSTVRRPVN
jgi:CheY-like chemotaxis protein